MTRSETEGRISVKESFMGQSLYVQASAQSCLFGDPVVDCSLLNRLLCPWDPFLELVDMPSRGFPDPGIKAVSLASALAGRFFTLALPGKPKELKTL